MNEISNACWTERKKKIALEFGVFGHYSEKNQISIFVSKKLKHVRAISTS